MEAINAHGRQVKYLVSTKGTLNDEERGWIEEVLNDCKVLFFFFPLLDSRTRRRTIATVHETYLVFRCPQIHNMAIAKLYTSDPGRGHWEFTGCIGGTAVVTEHGLYGVPSHYLRMVDLLAWNPVRPLPLPFFMDNIFSSLKKKKKNNALQFEQEMYQGFVYQRLTRFLHVFEMNEGIAALSFADDAEADRFFDAVQMCISTLPKDVLFLHPSSSLSSSPPLLLSLFFFFFFPSSPSSFLICLSSFSSFFLVDRSSADHLQDLENGCSGAHHPCLNDWRHHFTSHRGDFRASFWFVSSNTPEIVQHLIQSFDFSLTHKHAFSP